MAAHTKTVRLATGILILPQRNPVVLAKECATIDVLSGGRLELGVGIGWLEEEFDIIGVPFDERMARTDEYVEALRALWSDDETFNGQVHVVHERAELPEARAGPRHPDRRRRTHEGGRAARRPARQRVLPRAPQDIGVLMDEMRRAAKDAGRRPRRDRSHDGRPAEHRLREVARRSGREPDRDAGADVRSERRDRAFGELAENFISKVG